MKETKLTWPELVLLVGTRVAAGVGVGLLLSEKMDRSARRAAGVALLAVGALSTIPLAAELLGSMKRDGGDASAA
ncbi:MAG TPA: hypothetical protein VMD97_08565 [Candidatus Aquilonibacter sp.]|nr:hypothetical protein [Candidatus Aquilonibacter sp.]